MKLANPLHFPLAILAGGIVLVAGVRLLKLPNLVIIPIAGAIALGGATWRQSQVPAPIKIDNPALANELAAVQQQARAVAKKSETLRSEAEERLTMSSSQLELLSAVQYVCDRAQELPAKLYQMGSRLQQGKPLLSINELQQQLEEVQAKQRDSQGTSRQHLEQLADSLRHNIKLTQEGEDAREAQVISLSTMITDSAGALQQLQNKLRSADLEDSDQLQELRSLSEELSTYQANVDLLVRES